MLITLLAGGNGLLIGGGPRQDATVDTFGTVLGMDTKRIQFTPD